MKNWYHSKTILFNLITALVTIATVFGYTANEELATTLSTLFIALAPVVNIVLRLVTKTAISPTSEVIQYEE